MEVGTSDFVIGSLSSVYLYFEDCYFLMFLLLVWKSIIIFDCFLSVIA